MSRNWLSGKQSFQGNLFIVQFSSRIVIDGTFLSCNALHYFTVITVTFCYCLCRRLVSGEGIVSLGICLSRCVCVCVCRISLDGEGNVLYPVVSSCTVNMHDVGNCNVKQSQGYVNNFTCLESVHPGSGNATLPIFLIRWSIEYRRDLITKNLFREIKHPKHPLHNLLSPIKVSDSRMVLRPTYLYQLPVTKATCCGCDFVPYSISKKFKRS